MPQHRITNGNCSPPCSAAQIAGLKSESARPKARLKPRTQGCAERTIFSARPATYAWEIEFEPDLAGVFGRTDNRNLLALPNVVLEDLPAPTIRLEDEDIVLPPLPHSWSRRISGGHNHSLLGMTSVLAGSSRDAIIAWRFAPKAGLYGLGGQRQWPAWFRKRGTRAQSEHSAGYSGFSGRGAIAINGA